MKTQKKIQITLIILFLISIGNPDIYASTNLTDKDISNAVETELLFNATTPSYMLDVTTNEGIVTLDGSVNNILAKDRAVKIARTVKGVRGVVDQIEVDAVPRLDMNIANDVSEALFEDPATDSYEVDVSSNNGIVTLKGTVDSWQEKELCAFVVKGVRGVKGVNNEIDIIYNADRADYEIKKDIEQTLVNDIRVDDALIEVEVNKGNVELSGTVGSANEKSLARTNAWVTGVKSVDAEKLDVREWTRNENLRKNKYASKADDDIREAVKDALLHDPRVYSFNPDVSVDNGVVTLTGVVSNLKAKRAAEDDAKNVVGVFYVNNYLKVRPAMIPEDSELEADIKQGMLRDPVVEKYELDVTANNGVVFLNGTVDSYFEKIQAEDVASKAKGVIAVENNIKVEDDNDYHFYNYYGWNTYYPPYQIDVDDYYRTDSEIKDNIESQLWWSPYVDEAEVDVIVVNGEATLEGTVDTKREKLFAEINALEGGAKEVHNDLVVMYTP